MADEQVGKREMMRRLQAVLGSQGVVIDTEDVAGDGLGDRNEPIRRRYAPFAHYEQTQVGANGSILWQGHLEAPDDAPRTPVLFYTFLDPYGRHFWVDGVMAQDLRPCGAGPFLTDEQCKIDAVLHLLSHHMSGLDPQTIRRDA